MNAVEEVERILSESPDRIVFKAAPPLREGGEDTWFNVFLMGERAGYIHYDVHGHRLVRGPQSKLGMPSQRPHNLSDKRDGFCAGAGGVIRMKRQQAYRMAPHTPPRCPYCQQQQRPWWHDPLVQAAIFISFAALCLYIAQTWGPKP